MTFNVSVHIINIYDLRKFEINNFSDIKTILNCIENRIKKQVLEIGF